MAMVTEAHSAAGFSGSFLPSLMTAFRAVVGTLKFQRTLSELDDLGDRTLRDIGLTRADLIDLRMASSAEAMRALAFIRRR